MDELEEDLERIGAFFDLDDAGRRFLEDEVRRPPEIALLDREESAIGSLECELCGIVGSH